MLLVVQMVKRELKINKTFHTKTFVLLLTPTTVTIEAGSVPLVTISLVLLYGLNLRTFNGRCNVNNFNI